MSIQYPVSPRGKLLSPGGCDSANDRTDESVASCWLLGHTLLASDKINNAKRSMIGFLLEIIILLVPPNLGIMCTSFLIMVPRCSLLLVLRCWRANTKRLEISAGTCQ